MKIHKHGGLDVHQVYPPSAAPEATRVQPPPAAPKATRDDTTVAIAEGDRSGEVCLYCEVSREDSTGDSRHFGAITKAGKAQARWIWNEAVQHAQSAEGSNKPAARCGILGLSFFAAARVDMVRCERYEILFFRDADLE